MARMSKIMPGIEFYEYENIHLLILVEFIVSRVIDVSFQEMTVARELHHMLNVAVQRNDCLGLIHL